MMKRAIQKWTVKAALRLVYAALVELQGLDAEVAEEFAKLPAGMSYAIHTGYDCPTLFVQWDGERLRSVPKMERACCELHLKALAISFRLFTGQMGLAQAYARHAFTMSGEVADVMKLARLVNRTEAYLFPPFITRRFLSVLPTLPVSPLRLYGKLLIGFLKGKYA